MEKIVITGGSGLLGRALVARLHQQAVLTVLSRSEKGQLALRQQYPHVRCLLGDVRDRSALAVAFRGATIVLHAAALKHVPISEREPTEYTTVNVQGSLNVIQVARSAGVRRIVGISTDKACDPHNVYGLTKLLMERLLCEAGHVAVRYGNVFASDGSVIPIWQRQLAEAGTLSITDPTMTRFFFPVAAAVDEVLWTLDHAPAGTVVVPRLHAASLRDLAEAVIDHHGSGSWTVTGHRPGEKQHEALISAEEGAYASEQDGRVILGRTRVPVVCCPYDSASAPRISHQELLTWLG